MLGIVLVGHNDLAESMKSVAEHVVGALPDVVCVSVLPTDDIEEKRHEIVLKICEKAKKTVSLPYEAGRVGEDFYGNGGLTYAVYLTAGIELHPTIALQYESAKALYGWNEDETLVEMGDQVFFMKGETLLTGICVDENAVVFASPDHACVVLIEQFTERSEYEFVGSVYYL